MIISLLSASSSLEAAHPQVEIVTAGQQVLTGELAGWTTERFTIRGETPQSVATSEVCSIRFPDHRVRVVEGDWTVLPNGDRVAASVQHTRDDMAQATWTIAPLRPPWKGPLENVAAFVFNFPAAPRLRRDWLAAIDRSPPGDDVVQFIAGDRLLGEFTELDGPHITLEASFGATQIDRQRVRWISFDRELQTAPRPASVTWIVWLTDGSRITANDVQPGEDVDVQLTLAVGGTFNIPQHQLARLERWGERRVPLSRRAPLRMQYTPYLAGERTARADRNVLGSPLVVRGEESAYGIGMASSMSASYGIEPGDLEFRAAVGIDDAAEGRGSARFRVLLDDRLVWESEEITGQMPLVPVPAVALTGAKALTLQVDFGQAGDVGDYANWCDAAIIRR